MTENLWDQIERAGIGMVDDEYENRWARAQGRVATATEAGCSSEKTPLPAEGGCGQDHRHPRLRAFSSFCVSTCRVEEEGFFNPDLSIVAVFGYLNFYRFEIALYIAFKGYEGLNVSVLSSVVIF